MKQTSTYKTYQDCKDNHPEDEVWYDDFHNRYQNTAYKGCSLGNITKCNPEDYAPKTPLAGEWWMCHLKQGAWNRICVVYRPTDDLWDLPYEQLGVKWNQEDVTPLNRMIEEK